MNELDERKFTNIFDFVFKLVESKVGKDKASDQIDAILGATLTIYQETEDESWKLSD